MDFKYKLVVKVFLAVAVGNLFNPISAAQCTDELTLNFEGGSKTGWTQTGTAFDNQPTYGDNPTARQRGQPAEMEGLYWIGGYEDRPYPASRAGKVQRDGPQGTLTSSPFVILGDEITFLIGGGCKKITHGKVRVELLVEGKVRQTAFGRCTETMKRQKFHVGAYKLRFAQIRLVDHSSGGWGHINFDDMRGNIYSRETYCTNFHFECGSLHNWQKTGTAFNNQPTYGDNPTARKRGQASHHEGKFWIGGFENRHRFTDPAGRIQGDGPQGTLTSRSFRIIGNSITFLIGGGCDINKVRAELVVGGRVVRKSTGKCTETMIRWGWYVGDLIGRSAKVRLIDRSSAGWGHINFDDLGGDIRCLNF